MKKRLLQVLTTLLCAVLLIFSLAACGGDSADSTGGSGTGTTAPSGGGNESPTDPNPENPPATASGVLEYTLNANGRSYSVIGIGTVTGTELTIPATHEGLPVTSIGDSAFYGCVNLTSVTIPDSVTSIGGGAFDGCESLESITLPFVGAKKDGMLNNQFGYIFGVQAGYDNEFLPSLKTVVITGGTSIADSAFSDCYSLESLTIPDGVTSIGDYAFVDCESLESLTIPDSVTSIGEYAFNYSANFIQEENGVYYAGKWAVGYDGSATNPTLRSDTVGIADGAFRNYLSPTTIDIPDSVRNIGYDAFFWEGDPSILWESGIAYIDQWVIGCYGPEGDVTLRSDTVGIADGVFYYCPSLTGIEIPESVTSIGTAAFSGCRSLESITVAPNNPNYHSAQGCLIQTESKTLVAGCKNSVIPTDGSVTSIGDAAFYGCRSLESLTIPDSVTSIGYQAFYNCTSLESLTIPDSVTSIGSYAFAYCFSLTNITIPDSVTSIGGGAFYYCSGLTSITFADTSTWYRTTDSSYTGGTQVDLTNASQNATYFTDTYEWDYWYKL